MTSRRIAVAVAGFVGAELVGVAGYALGASLLAFDRVGPAIAGLMLAPILAAAAGPLGYDVATWWASDADRAIRAEPGFRAAAHSAGVAGALLVLLLCLVVAAAAPTAPTVHLFFLALCLLPRLAVTGRRVATSFSESDALLPVSLVTVVATGPGLVVAYAWFITRMLGED